MRIFLTATFLFIVFLAIGQGFNRRYDAFGWGDPQGGWNVEFNGTGYTVISGMTNTDSLGPSFFLTHGSVLLTFLDANGVKLNEKRSYRPYHTAVAGWANCCDTIPGGGYIVGGASEDTTGFDEVYLMRFDSNGDTLWTKVFGDPNGEKFWIGYQVKRAPNGDFLIAGITDQNGPFNAFVIRTDSNGDELWRSIYVYAPGIEGGLGSLALAANDDFFSTGTIALSPTNSDRWVQRHAQNGSVLWQVGWGGEWREGSPHISTLSDGNLLVSGGMGYAVNLTQMRPYLAKLDSNDGSIVWEHEYGPIAYGTQFFPSKECPNGDIIAAGVTYHSGDQQGLLCRTTSEGDSLWMFSYYYQDSLMSDGQGRFYDVLPTADGGFIAAGAGYHSPTLGYPVGYSQDTWVVKVDGQGCIIPGCNTVGITEQATNLQDALSLFPNPVASGQPLNLQLDLPPSVANQPLQLSVVSLDGRVVHQQNLAGNGAHSLALQPEAAGVYYVHIAAGSKWLTGGKFVVE